MKSILIGLLTLSSLSAFANDLCLNQVGRAAYSYTLKNLQTKLDRVHSTASAAISSINSKGAIMDDTIYEVRLSGRQVTSSGAIIGPATFSVEVYVNNSNCKISRISH